MASVLAAGVKVAVRVRPVPLNAPSVPPVVAMSPASKLAPGSSLKLKVMVAAVSAPPAALSSALSLVITTLGAWLSMACRLCTAAALALPAASSAALAATSSVMAPVKLSSAVTLRVYCVALTAVKVPLVPPTKVMSLASKPVTASLNTKL